MQNTISKADNDDKRRNLLHQTSFFGWCWQEISFCVNDALGSYNFSWLITCGPSYTVLEKLSKKAHFLVAIIWYFLIVLSAIFCNIIW